MPRVMVNSQACVSSISRRREKRSMATPATGARPRAVTERRRLTVPRAAPDPVSS